VAKLEWVVGAEAAGRRLDGWLARRPEIGSRGRAREYLARGKLFLNGRELSVADQARRLRPGDRLMLWEDRPGSARPVPRPIARARSRLRVVFEDRALVVVDKPPGLLVEPLPGREASEVTLVDLVADHLRGSRHARPLVVHRIDRDTSGLVVFARDRATQTALKRQFAARRVERVYLAVVEGRLEPAEGTWVDRLRWDAERRRQRPARAGDPKAREAVAHYRVVERFAAATLVEVRLVTGKRNQIRLQAALRGHPLVGERQYRHGRRPPASVPGHGRQALHAARLAFDHPATGERITLEAPLAADLVRLVETLRGRPA
jgi:23S rRNA pseudouridine1911/1915/1917 synthase